MTTNKPKNHGKKRSSEEIKELKEFAKLNTPTRVIWLNQKLGRSESSIYAKARTLGISLKPNNRSPYGKKWKNKSSNRK